MKLKYDEPLSNFAFNSKLRRYTQAMKARGDVDEFDYDDEGEAMSDELKHEIEASEKLHRALEDEVHKSEVGWCTLASG